MCTHMEEEGGAYTCVRSRSHTFYFKAPNYMLARTLTERLPRVASREALRPARVCDCCFHNANAHQVPRDVCRAFFAHFVVENSRLYDDMPLETPTHTPPGGARPTPSAQYGPICTRTPCVHSFSHFLFLRHREIMSQDFRIWRDKQTIHGQWQNGVWRDRQNQAKQPVLESKTR